MTFGRWKGRYRKRALGETTFAQVTLASGVSKCLLI
jgi:hypothetical protein